jgi:hypothetical protein
VGSTGAAFFFPFRRVDIDTGDTFGDAVVSLPVLLVLVHGSVVIVHAVLTNICVALPDSFRLFRARFPHLTDYF